MADVIGPFQGEFRFLSNFWPAKVVLDGVAYPSTEHAYQAAKTLDPKERATIRSAPRPGDAKRKGAKVTLREDWDTAKLTVMEDLLRQKFSVEPLRSQLLATAPAALVEYNTWGDTFWGVYENRGQNYLGRLLIKIREEIRTTIKAG